MKKKVLSLFLVGAMTAGLVAGCGSSNEGGEASNTVSEGTEAAADGAEGSVTYTNDQIILGVVSETSGDITPSWVNGAGDYTAYQLITGMAPIDCDQDGKWVENPSVLENLEAVDNEDGSKTYTVTIKDGLKFSDGADVTAEDYFYTPAIWASQNKVVSGYEGGIFAPHNTIARAETVTMLYRYYK